MDTAPVPPPSATSSAAPAPARAPVPIRAVVDAAERAVPGMTLGVAVLDLSTGELVAGRDGDRQFYSASLSKLIVVVDMLDRARAEGLAITGSDFRQVARALTDSDDGAMNVLWSKFDGRGAINRVGKRLGLAMTRAPADPSQWGETLVTATDLVRIYQHILRDMAVEDRTLIVSALAATRARAADGSDQNFGLLKQGASAQTYAKQGWVSYLPARFHLHSAGVVRGRATGNEFAVALLSIQAAGSRVARDRLSTVAGVLVETLGAA